MTYLQRYAAHAANNNTSRSESYAAVSDAYLSEYDRTGDLVFLAGYERCAVNAQHAIGGSLALERLASGEAFK